MKNFGWILAAAMTAASVQAGMIVQTWGPGKDISYPGSLKIAAGGRAAATIEVDLAAIPKGVKLYWARLYLQRAHVIVPAAKRGEEPPPVPDDALDPVEVFPGDKPAGKALDLVGPWFDCLDATAAATAAAGGQCVFAMKPLGDWVPDATYLEAAWESPAEPRTGGPQVKDLKAIHRSGQTFLTWKEVADAAGKDELTWAEFRKARADADLKERVRYHIYRSDKPITPETLKDAERIAVVKPLSGWNANGRNSERPMDIALATRYAYIWPHWNPFADARVDGPWGVECPIDRFAIEDGGQPLPRDTGLYVITTAEKGKVYYAVIASVNGTAHVAAIGAGRSLEAPVDESVAKPTPVLQRELPPTPFWDYPEKRLHYVQWVGPRYGNLPSQYYNWSVSVPNALEKSVPMELSLPREDRSYWRTQYRIERDSIVATPYDFHTPSPGADPVETWWYGYHAALGTLKSFRQGAVRNYTEQRLLAFVDWACGKWPVDRNRILVTAMRRSSGGSGGAWATRGCSTGGALHLGLRHPRVFSSVLIGSNARADYAADVAPSMICIWGKPEWEVKTDSGNSLWNELNLVNLVTALPASEDLPLVTTTGRGVTDSERAFFNALLAKGEPLMANFGYWGGPKLLPVSASGTWPSPMMRIDVRRDLPLPAFRSVSLEKSKVATPDIPADVGKPYGTINAQLRWSGADAEDKADRLALTLWVEGRAGETATTDVIVRRRGVFKPAAGSACRWEYGADDGQKQSGELTVGPDGLLLVPAVKIGGSPGRLVVTLK